MKGGAAHWIIIGLVIGVIVIAIALGPLQYLSALDVWFFTDKTKLVNYATCSLALCANGIGSAQVDKVGCLEREGWQCTKSCRQVAEDFKNNDWTFIDLEGRPHYCGEHNALEFEFDDAVPVNIKSGEVQGLAKPKWACEGLSVGGMTVQFSQNVQKNLGECSIMSGFLSEPGLNNLLLLNRPNPGAIGKECFDGFRSVTFTPLMPYSSVTEDNKYPSAVYLGSEIAAECELSGGGPIYTGVPFDVASGDDKGETLPTFSQCTIKSIDDQRNKNKFKVWTETVVNKPYIRSILGDDDVDFRTPIRDLFERVREIGEQYYTTINTCAVSVLTKADSSVLALQEQQRFIASADQLYPDLVARGDQIYLFYQESNDLDVSKLTSSAIKSVKLSTDGKFETLDGAQIVKGYDGHMYVRPSVTVLNGHRYLAYTVNTGELGAWEIFVQDLETGAISQVTHGRKDLSSELSYFSPSITSFNGKLYLAAHQENRLFNSLTTDIIYSVGTVNGDTVDWEDYRTIPSSSLKGNGENSYPSIAVTSDGVMVSYSFRDTTRLESDPRAHPSIGVVLLRDGNWQDAGTVASGNVFDDTSGNTFVTNNGFSHLVSGGRGVFFDQGSGNPGNADFQRRLVYSNYLGNGQWSAPVTVSDRRALMASATQFKGMVVLAFTELASDFDLVIATEGGRPLNVEEVSRMEVMADKESYSSGETIVFSGILEINGEPAAGKDVTIELTQVSDFGPVLKGGENVRTNNEGIFNWETEIPTQSKVSFEALVKYEKIQSEPFRFTVG